MFPEPSHSKARAPLISHVLPGYHFGSVAIHRLPAMMDFSRSSLPPATPPASGSVVGYSSPGNQMGVNAHAVRHFHRYRHWIRLLHQFRRSRHRRQKRSLKLLCSH